ncbi:MAG: hypothetical protein ABSF91_09420 [Bacteroidota bacterium]
MNQIEIEHGDAEQRSLHRIFDTKTYDDCEIRWPNMLIIKDEEVFENIEDVLNRISTLSLGPSPKPVLSEVEGWERDVTK